MKPIKKILIICTGNSCRSIMAQGYLAKRFTDQGITNIDIVSAGTGTIPGRKPTEETIEVMKENGIDVSGYTSSSLMKEHVESADLILVMEPWHRYKILMMAKEAKDKIHLLRQFSSDEKRDSDWIDDPIGKSIEFYREIFKVIKDSIEGFLKWLNE